MTTHRTPVEWPTRPSHGGGTTPAEPDPTELSALLARLAEAEETLRAIRQGEVDSVVVEGPDGPRTFTLVTADTPYRTLVEQIREGALTLSSAGVILYANRRLAPLVGLDGDVVAGLPLAALAIEEDRPLVQDLVARAMVEEISAEVRLRRADGGTVPAQISLAPLRAGDFQGAAGIVTDLTDQKRREQAAAEERLTNAILEYAGTAILLCDQSGAVVRANRAALELCGPDVCEHPFDDAFRPGAFRELARALDTHETHRDLEHRRPDGRRGYVLAGARPLADAAGPVFRWVITLADITERKALEAERTRLLEAEHEARELAEAANVAKTRFLAIISHELRTPLNAVIGYADLLLEGMAGQLATTQEAYISRIKASAWHLLGLIEEILTYSRIEAGRDTVHLQPVDLCALVSEAAAFVETQVRDKGLELRLVLPDCTARADTDPGKLRQILLNLLANAVKFTDHGHIALELETRAPGYRVHVRDSGPGIPARDLERIFEPFTQLDQSNTRVNGGTGLGLAITRRFADLLGCTIHVESRAGEGSTFTVAIPPTPPPQAGTGATPETPSPPEKN